MARYSEKLWSGSITLKVLIIAIVALLLLIPGNMIQSLVKERAQNRDDVMTEVQAKWGHPQSISGPFLTIPYKEYYTNSEGQRVFRRQSTTFLPNELNINGRLEPHIRKRSLYRVLLYKSQLKVTGHFTELNLEALNIKSENVLWDEAELVIGISDLRGLQRQVHVNFEDNPQLEAQPGVNHTKGIESGLSVPLPDSALQEIGEKKHFQFELHLNGSRSIDFSPTGKTTRVNITSPWGSPSFHGAFLPEHTIRNDQFEAQWKVLDLNRNFPQQWKNKGQFSLKKWHFGVELMFPINPYQKAERAVKYAVIFIGLTFLVFFFSEVLTGKKVHPIQYVLVGFALLLFYLLLLSLSEYWGFNLSYLVAGAATVALISWYSHFTLTRGYTAAVFLALGLLYTYLFTILQMEDFALLIGSIGLFVIISVVMYISRHINWYASENTLQKNDAKSEAAKQSEPGKPEDKDDSQS